MTGEDFRLDTAPRDYEVEVYLDEGKRIVIQYVKRTADDVMNDMHANGPRCADGALYYEVRIPASSNR